MNSGFSDWFLADVPRAKRVKRSGPKAGSAGVPLCKICGRLAARGAYWHLPCILCIGRDVPEYSRPVIVVEPRRQKWTDTETAPLDALGAAVAAELDL
jgi:hypothetical protein